MIVILHDIRSLYNVGSIFRTADAVGVEKIYLCGITPKPIDEFDRPREQLVKVSLGAEKYILWEKVSGTSGLIDYVRKKGYTIFAVEQNKKSIPYYELSKFHIPYSKFCLMLGGEVKGLPLSILKKADKILEIPMHNAVVRQAHHPRHTGHGKESLNVSVAFGIVAYHLTFGHKKKTNNHV